MRNIRFAIVLVMALFLTGCNDFVSLYPLYDDLSLTFDPAFVGSWEVEEGETWTFKKGDEARKYKVTIADATGDEGKPETHELEGGLVNLSGRLFLDLSSDDTGLTGAPAHIFARVRIVRDYGDGENKLEVAWLSHYWMEETLKQEKQLTHMPASHGKTIITAPTLDLQDFFRRHAWDEEAFSSARK